MPLTDYLIGSSSCKGAHERFHPNDWTPSMCRSKLSQTPLRKSALDVIHKNYLDICEHIKPVFHHFFLEYFHNPGVWFERRMAYAHSLATTSMIGYILGIGDRHVSNILIDKTTAELIHIDFGIAFEQGKCLPTPELIPFRLTRDMVSALGPSGVEGVYRKSCEKTMEVLRQNKSTILTIVEVLLHDPLYAWTLTSDQASRRQQTDIEIDKGRKTIIPNQPNIELRIFEFVCFFFLILKTKIRIQWPNEHYGAWKKNSMASTLVAVMQSQ